MSSELEERFNWFVEKAKLTPMPHQTEAVKWMLRKELQQEQGIRGGLLADEMGLGKTIMMIGLLVSNYVRKTLIVVPAPLVKQWTTEFKRTTGHNLLVWSSKTPEQALNAAPFVITTYNKFALSTFKKDVKALGSESLKGYDLEKTTALHKIVWDRAIFDEAHHLRNKNGNFWAAKILRTGAKWLISGTPVQNRKQDFYNLCSIIGLPASYYSDEEQRQELLDSYVLRRTKEKLGIQMPGIQITRKPVLWSSEKEEKLSNDIHTASKYASKESRLKLINFARQSCTLPEMLTDKIPGLVKTRELSPEHKQDYLTGSKACSKIDEVIKTLVERKDNGAGKLVFCHFRQEIDVIEEKLKAHCITNVGKLDGRTKPKDKQRMIKEGVQVLILQIQTGCEGINLQEHYSEVYFVSPNWNPAVEEQAIARCHRIGQQKDVAVFRYNMTSNPPSSLEGFAQEDARECDSESEELESPDQYIKDVQERKNQMRTLFV
jgi:SNF2 family DNA or RNA helicase